MFDITDRTHTPTAEELDGYIANPLFAAMTQRLTDAFCARCEAMYSGDKVLLGWNLRFFRGGKTLCRLYPKRGYFTVLVVVGRKEKPQVEALLPGLSGEMRAVYEGAQEGMGQRWLLIDLHADDALYRDVLTLVTIRKDSR